jgi:uncharacterized protein DUF6968/uncharacterized protein DUF3658
MGYPESFNELARWWDTLRLTSDGDAVIRAIEDRIGQESGERRRILHRFLYQEYRAQGREDAARAIRGLDVLEPLHRWYEQWRREGRDADIIPALEERIHHEVDAERVDALRFLLASEHRRRGNYAAAEAVQLADIAAHPDEPMPLIILAEQKLFYEENPQAARPIIDRAIEVAMRAGTFRRHALADKARIALALNDFAAVEEVLRRIMALTFTRGNADIGVERDFFDRLPPGSIDPQVARAYEEYCRARGETRTTTQFSIDRMVQQVAKPNWLKVARIVADVLSECERHQMDVSGDSVADSIRFLVEQGKLEAQGDLAQWRFSEVRLPAAAAKEAGEASSGAETSAQRESTVVIARRTLTMEVDGRDVAVPVTLYAPVDKTDHWCCEFEIAWPDKPKLGKGNGLDAVQALLIALEMVGINLYSSDAHKQGKLKLDEPHGGYGFPLNSALRDLYEGRDRYL